MNLMTTFGFVIEWNGMEWIQCELMVINTLHIKLYINILLLLFMSNIIIIIYE
jgi:hypothetical protein